MEPFHEAAQNWLIVFLCVIFIEGCIVGLAYYRRQLYGNHAPTPEWLQQVYLYLVPEIWIRKQNSQEQAAVAKKMRRQQQKAMSSVHMNQTTDFSMISNILQTLGVQDQNELSLPGFLEVDSKKECKIQNQVAKGGAGVIYVVELLSKTLIDRSGGRTRAIMKQIGHPDKTVPDELQAAFCQEVSMMYYFREHGKFAQLYGFGFDPLTIIMKQYKFGSLGNCIFTKARRDNNMSGKVKSDAVLEKSQYIDENNELIWNSLLIAQFFYDMADALNAMHQAGITHNDMKPDNVLIDFVDSPDGMIHPTKRPFCVLTDLGISQILGVNQLNIVRSFKIVKITGASAAFASPETFLRLESGHLKDSAEEVATALGKAIDEEMALLNTPAALKASDCYSLAVTVYEMLNKRKAWRKVKTREEVQAKVFSGERPEYEENVKRHAAKDQLFKSLMNLVDDAWRQDPYQRPTMLDLKQRLDDLINAEVLKSSQTN